MFEITGADIKALNDTDLRGLIGLLCETELRRRGLTTSAVTAGGDQDAPDGGTDVRVKLPAGTQIDGSIPKAHTVFQSKKSGMPRSAILKEMREGANIKPMIAELAALGGAYIIASSGDNTTETMLRDREAAMKEAMKGVPSAEKLTLAFYDQSRLATWVRDHPGLIPWVRSKIGRALQGWKSHGSWSYRPAESSPAYLLDDAVRVRRDAQEERDGLTAVAGMNRIRNTLNQAGASVRLVGLSGVGKTRFAEALFDNEVGASSLDPSLAIYTDIADDPIPQPASLVSDLISARTRAIVIVDNCKSDTHRRLTEIVTAESSTVSLLTIEYDIQDGEPEDTHVFALEASSPQLIEKLVATRFRMLSQVDARKVAELSGGNARIALALANAAPKNGTLASLGDRELFRRLFDQRNVPDTPLLSSAQVCSLLYSFEGESFQGAAAEMPILGTLIGRSAEEVHIACVELKRRQLLQARGPWRAVLPHAIANRLAAAALEEIPRERLLNALAYNAPERIARSFSRRLGYLDTSKEAQSIVQEWLSPGGYIHEVDKLGDFGLAVLKNVAPVAPDAVLAALETALLHADDEALERGRSFTGLLRAIAYEPALFKRAVTLMARMAKLPKGRRIEEEPASALESLFMIRLSGTLAPLEMRLQFIETLLRSGAEGDRNLGLKLLQAVLKSDFFSSGYGFEFGARSRGYGLNPPNGPAVQEWYAEGLKLSALFVLGDSSLGESVRRTIASSFRGLWVRGGQGAVLTQMTREIVEAHGFWREGWAAVRRTRIYESENLSPESLSELGALEDTLRPRDTVEKVRAVVLSGQGRGIDIEDYEIEEGDITSAIDKENKFIALLARDVNASLPAWRELLPGIVAANNYKIGFFGEELAKATADPTSIWADLISATKESSSPGISVLTGFIGGIAQRDPTLADKMVDEILGDPSLASWTPIIQARMPMNDNALSRLHQVLDTGAAPIERFEWIAYGGASETITEYQLKNLLLKIASIDGGVSVALRILHGRFHADQNASREIGFELLETGRALLIMIKFRRKNERLPMEDYELGAITRLVLDGDKGKAVARDLCRNIMSKVATYEISSYDYSYLMEALFQTQPLIMLDTLFSGDEMSQRMSISLINDLPRPGKPPMDWVPDDLLISWCQQVPDARYVAAALFATLFRESEDEEPLAWTALPPRLLSDAPDPAAVFEAVAERLRPRSWSGSLATAYEARLKLLQRLDVSTLPALLPLKEKAIADFTYRVDRERTRELAEDTSCNNRFE